jgi:hypothetical protein
MSKRVWWYGEGEVDEAHSIYMSPPRVGRNLK